MYHGITNVAVNVFVQHAVTLELHIEDEVIEQLHTVKPDPAEFKALFHELQHQKQRQLEIWNMIRVFEDTASGDGYDPTLQKASKVQFKPSQLRNATLRRAIITMRQFLNHPVTQPQTAFVQKNNPTNVASTVAAAPKAPTTHPPRKTLLQPPKIPQKKRARPPSSSGPGEAPSPNGMAGPLLSSSHPRLAPSSNVPAVVQAGERVMLPAPPQPTSSLPARTVLDETQHHQQEDGAARSITSSSRHVATDDAHHHHDNNNDTTTATTTTHKPELKQPKHEFEVVFEGMSSVDLSSNEDYPDHDLPIAISEQQPVLVADSTAAASMSAAGAMNDHHGNIAENDEQDNLDFADM